MLASVRPGRRLAALPRTPDIRTVPSLAASSAQPRSASPTRIGPGALGLSLLALALITEYRIRTGVSATVPELAGYLAALALLLEPQSAPATTSSRRLWAAFAIMTALLLARAFYFRLALAPDVESPFSHVRDAALPLFLVVLVHGRVRLGSRALGLCATSFVFMGALAGALGLLQFFRGGPFFFEGIDIVKFKTLTAQNYWIARILHLHVTAIARGLYGFSLAYAASLVLPAVTAFALAFRGPPRQRIFAAIAFCLIYAGIYFSFSRSMVAVVPVGCFLAVRAITGKLRPSTCMLAVLGYIGVAFVAPALHLTRVDDSDLGTLNSRAETIVAFFAHVKRDPSMLVFGSQVAFWREWNLLSPHNWIINSLLNEGIPIAALRLGTWVALLSVLFPVVKRGRPVAPLRAGLWCGSFSLLAIIGETEPFNGISQYLVAAFGLALLAAARPEADPTWLPNAPPPHFEIINGGGAAGA